MNDNQALSNAQQAYDSMTPDDGPEPETLDYQTECVDSPINAALVQMVKECKARADWVADNDLPLCEEICEGAQGEYTRAGIPLEIGFDACPFQWFCDSLFAGTLPSEIKLEKE